MSTQTRPSVSVIIPNYNYSKTLALCLTSALAQTHRPAEVIVVDDASTDRSRDIAARFGCTLIEQPVNRGVSAARNAGAAAASGEILFFLDSDVALAPDAVAGAVGQLAADPGCGCVYGVYGKRPLIDDGPVEWYRILHLHSALARDTGVTATAFFALAAMPRAVFADIGPFDERLRSAEDDEYSERLIGRYRIRRTGTVVGYHDDAERLLPLLREQYQRARLMPFSARNRMRRAALKLNRGTGLAAAVLAVGTATLPIAALAAGAASAGALSVGAVPAGFLALFAAADPGLARFVLREKGPGFLAFFLGVHFLMNLALAAGAATGYLRVITRSPSRHRRSYHNVTAGVGHRAQLQLRAHASPLPERDPGADPCAAGDPVRRRRQHRRLGAAGALVRRAGAAHPV
jgi:GT2 family glycosyltransferase